MYLFAICVLLSDSAGILPRDTCPFRLHVYSMYIVYFESRSYSLVETCVTSTSCGFRFLPVVLVLLRYPRHVGSMCGSRSSVIAATMPCPCDVLTLQWTRLTVAFIISYVTRHLLARQVQPVVIYCYYEMILHMS